jgi:hypothetical protein
MGFCSAVIIFSFSSSIVHRGWSQLRNLARQQLGLVCKCLRSPLCSDHDPHPFPLEADAPDHFPGPLNPLLRPPVPLKVPAGSFGAGNDIGGVSEFLQGLQKVDRFQSAAAWYRKESDGPAVFPFQGLAFRFTAPGNILAVEKGEGWLSFIIHFQPGSFREGDEMQGKKKTFIPTANGYKRPCLLPQLLFVPHAVVRNDFFAGIR